MQLLWRATARKAARLGTRPARRQSCDLRQDLRSHDGKHVTSALLVDGVMLIVTREPIEAGQEVCIDYEDGGALGFAGVRLKHQHSCVLADEGSARARRRSELANRRRRCHTGSRLPGGTSVGDLPTSSASAVQLIPQTMCSARTPPVVGHYGFSSESSVHNGSPKRR